MSTAATDKDTGKPAGWRLRVVTSIVPERIGQEHAIDRALQIGRDPSSDLVLPDSMVSRRHARVEVVGDVLRVTDLGSGNGVYVGSSRIAQTAQLRGGEQFRIGETVFECIAPPPPAPPPPPPSPAPRAAIDEPTSAYSRAELLAAANEPTGAPFIVRILEGNEHGREVLIPSGSGTIGRGAACTVVVSDVDVSRQHARIESTRAGFLITDAGSSYGLWVGGKQVQSHYLTPGEPFRLGESTVLACVPATEAEEPAETRFIPSLALTPKSLVTSDPTVPRSLSSMSEVAAVVASPNAVAAASPAAAAISAKVATPAPVATPVAPAPVAKAPAESPAIEKPAPAVKAPAPPAATAAPAKGATAQTAFVPPKPAPAAKPAPAPPAAKTPAAKPAPAPKPAPAAAPAQAGVTEDDFNKSVVMKLPDILRAASASIDTEGEVIELLAHRPLILDNPEDAYVVVSGGVMVFFVTLENGQPIGTRTHFLGLLPGQCFIGFEPTGQGTSAGFLAVAKQGTKVRKLTRTRLREIAANPDQRATVAGLVDVWVAGLSKALGDGIALKPGSEVKLAVGSKLELPAGKRITSGGGTAWVELWSGAFIFDDLTTPTFTHRRVLLPMTEHCWIEPLPGEFEAGPITPVATATALDDADGWNGLAVFQQAIRQSALINTRLATLDEAQRLDIKKSESDAASRAGYQAIGSVLQTEGEKPLEFRASSSAEAVFRAAQMVGDYLGIEVRQPISTEEDLPFEERVTQVASTSGFRTRVVALRDEWWTKDHGAMLGQLSASKEPVALLPDGPTAYTLIAGNTPPQRVTAQIAQGLSGFAYTLYRPLPEGQLKVSDVMKFGARHLGRDVRWVVAMAIIVGFAGTITPWLTGKVFDSAIPEADRSALWGIGFALLGSAIATSLFKTTQGIATIRMQTRTASTIQAAVWDRLMNLPVNFFRKFSAGDLADRADGVEAIQNLISGAGVAAILGSVSGLFFIVQMFGYNTTLALLAVLLTLIYVGVNMSANYAQLRSQRVEIQLRGRITGLVLNLVSGVSKLRISGAEQHAFKVWATQFSEQRKITFRVGTIQNMASVFSSSFPVLASMSIFLVVISEQTKAAQANAPALTTGEFIAFNAAFGLFLGAMQALGDASLSLLRVVPIYERLLPILTTPPEVDRSKVFPGKLTGAIELSHLHFRYDPEGPYIVKDVSLKINSGEFVAFVGSSGCGKSTLMRLMLGFESPASGAVYYDGQDLPSLDLRAVRQQMGVVMQQSRVMPTEMYRNIIGASSRSIDDAWVAAEKAGLADDIRAMPMGMHTYVSEGGGTLSGGQRQRLMIARAIVNRPKIIFLDEATSALDNRTQAIVTESMDKMDATRIVIAHRLSTIKNADRICYLQGGQIIEMGSYDELMAKNGLFAELARRQMA